MKCTYTLTIDAKLVGEVLALVTMAFLLLSTFAFAMTHGTIIIVG